MSPIIGHSARYGSDIDPRELCAWMLERISEAMPRIAVDFNVSGRLGLLLDEVASREPIDHLESRGSLGSRYLTDSAERADASNREQVGTPSAGESYLELPTAWGPESNEALLIRCKQLLQGRCHQQIRTRLDMKFREEDRDRCFELADEILARYADSAKLSDREATRLFLRDVELTLRNREALLMLSLDTAIQNATELLLVPKDPTRLERMRAWIGAFAWVLKGLMDASGISDDEFMSKIRYAMRDTKLIVEDGMVVLEDFDLEERGPRPN